jgi:hypothetical protein
MPVVLVGVVATLVVVAGTAALLVSSVAPGGVQIIQ